MNEPTKPATKETQCGIAVTELLIAIATLGAAVLFGAMSDPKLPPGQSN